MILSFAAAIAYWELRLDVFWISLLAAALLLLSGYCDALDGVVARQFHQATAFGGFVDSVLDRYADAAVITGIILGGFVNTIVGILALVGSLLVSYARARAEAAGTKMESIGIAERAERIIILAAATFATFAWSIALDIGLIIIAILAHLTVVQRILYAYTNMKKKETD